MQAGEPERVLFVCLGDFRAGASARHIYLFARALSEAGCDTRVLVAGDPSTVSELGESFDPEVSVGSYRFALRRLTRKTVRDALSFRPDVVHVFEPRHVPALAALELADRTRARLFVRFADDDRSIETAAGGDVAAAGVAKAALKTVARVVPRVWPLAHPVSMERMRESATAFDAISPALAREIEVRFGRPCRCILPAVPPSASSDGPPPRRGEFGLPENGRLVLFAGSVYRPQFADFELLLRSFRYLADRRHDVHLVQTGRMAERYTPAMLAELMGSAAERFHPLGYLSTESDVARLMRACDVLVQPGAPTDFNRLRLPAKLHDYLAAGRPVVSYATGIDELLTDEVHALLTRTADPRELAAATERVLDDTALARRLGEAGRLRANELFSLERAARDLVEHYRRPAQVPVAS